MQYTATLTAARRACAAALAALAAAASAQPAPTAAPRDGIVGVVSGILGYTRWPAESGSLRLCLLGRGTALDQLRGAPLGSPLRPVQVQTLVSMADATSGCDAVYLAGLDGPATRSLLRKLSGQPVLLLGEGAEFCSDGGMFCLEPAAASTRFGANLDAIARSGLRVNPMVLRVAQSASGARP